MTYKSYRVDFKYTVVESASMYVIAETEDAAVEGGKHMLAQISSRFPGAEVTGAAEFTDEEKPQPQSPTIN